MIAVRDRSSRSSSTAPSIVSTEPSGATITTACWTTIPKRPHTSPAGSLICGNVSDVASTNAWNALSLPPLATPMNAASSPQR